jgi:rhamnose transport system permease protein
MSVLRRQGWELFLVVLILATALLNTVMSPYYMDPAQILSGLQYVVVPGIIALGLTPIVVMGEIDISLMALVAVGTVLFGWLSVLGLPVLLAIPIVFAVGAAAGLANGLIVTSYALPSMAVTLGSMAAFRGIAYLLPGGSTGYSSQQLGADYQWLGSTVVGIIPVSLVVFLLVAVFFAVLMHRTVFGRLAFAAGNNRVATRYSGTRVRLLLVMAYGMAGVATMLSALVFVGYTASARGDNGGTQLLLVVTCVVLGGIELKGGKGNLAGVFLAILLLGTLSNGMGLANIDAPQQVIVFGVILIGAVLAPVLTTGARRWLRARRRGAFPIEARR